MSELKGVTLGFDYNGQKVSVTYDVEGLKISRGDAAKYDYEMLLS